jgi:hypothetical protein
VTCIAIEIDGRELCGSDLLQDLKEQEGQRHQSIADLSTRLFRNN